MRQDKGSLFGQGSLQDYQDVASHQIIHRAFQWLGHMTDSKVTGLHFRRLSFRDVQRGPYLCYITPKVEMGVTIVAIKAADDVENDLAVLFMWYMW